MRLGTLLLVTALCSCSAEKRPPVSAPDAPVEGTVAVPGSTIAYDVRGSGPAVVLIPGGSFDRRLWDGQVEALAEHFRVIRYDVRTTGRSGAGGPAPYQHHEDLIALLRHLHVDRASIVGQSLGGRIAFDVALSHPEMVDRIVAVGPGISGFPWATAGFGPWLERFRNGLIKHDTAEAVAGWLASGYMETAAANPAIRPMLERYARENARSWFDSTTENELDPPALGRLAEIKAPTLLVIGSRDEKVILRIADSLQAHLPNVKRETFVDAGHALNLERPADFNRIVVAFLRGQ